LSFIVDFQFEISYTGAYLSGEIMRKLFEYFVYYFLTLSLWFRYRITFKGLENINPKVLNKPGGVLFLPNHPSLFIDPVAVTKGIWFKYPIRPIIIEYMYYVPIIHGLMRFVDAIPIPDNEKSSNSLKRRRNEKALQQVIKGLKDGQNFLIYPGGRLKETHREVIGGSSGVHTILQNVPEANVVLVRTTGLWGSIFSKAFSERTPPFFPTLLRGIKIAFKNLLFFAPRREITVEFLPAPADFPYGASRLELNRYLENWYNKSSKPTGLSSDKYPGEPLNLVPYSFWRNDLPQPKKEVPLVKEEIDLSKISPEIRTKVIEQLAIMTERAPESIKSEMNLSTDLGLDSLDASELILFLQEQFELGHIPSKELTTVGKVMAIANKQATFAEEEEEDKSDITSWNKPSQKGILTIADGKTIIEVFLNNCERMGKSVAFADIRSGVLNFKTAKLRVILLAEYIRKLPGEHIGIVLPASVAATLTYLACLLAGKIPVMINWTVGPRHLDSVVALSGIKTVISSWSFVDRLSNIDFTPIQDMMLMLEDVRRELSLKDKLKAALRSKHGTKSLLRTFRISTKKESDTAVILFTSGTESQPKGVPLSNNNILSNLRSLTAIEVLEKQDSFFAILPPFHSFGLTACALLGPLSGMKVAFYPDPTDGRNLARQVEKWRPTMMVGAPSFLRKLLKAATPNQIKSLRFMVTGAEKAPAELFQMAEQLGIGHTVYEGYGVTECSPVLTSNYPGPIPEGGVGRPLPNIEILIVHQDTHEILPQGKQGLILAKGPNVFAGYLNKDVKSPFVNIQGEQWYNTGDLGFIDELGRLTISGRLKRFIKVGGEMISLGALEEALVEIAIKNKWPLEEEGPTFAVCVKEANGDKPRIAVFAKCPVDVDLLNRELKQIGFSNLVKINMAKQIEEIPLMGAGKIHYRELEARYM
jgi:long-chain-fatty-acid--[acyl-carrier-protein] ligase